MCEVSGRDVVFWLLFGGPMIACVWVMVWMMFYSACGIMRRRPF